MRAFKNKWFSRFAKKNHISDEKLREIANGLEQGRWDADLGLDVYKRVQMRWCDRPYKKKWFRSEPMEAIFGDVLPTYKLGMMSQEKIMGYEEDCIKPEYLAKAREVRARAEKKMLAKNPAAEVPLTPSSMASAPYRTEQPRPAFAAKQ